MTASQHQSSVSSPSDSSFSKLAKWAAVATVGSVTVAFLGYAVYFDYKRRTDPAFRANIERKKREAAKVERELAAQEQRKGKSLNSSKNTFVIKDERELSEMLEGVSLVEEIADEEALEFATQLKSPPTVATSSGSSSGSGKKASTRRKSPKHTSLNNSAPADLNVEEGFSPASPAEAQAMIEEALPMVDLSLEELSQLSPEQRQKVFYATLVIAETLLNEVTSSNNSSSIEEIEDANGGEGGPFSPQQLVDKALGYFVKAALLVPSPMEVIAAYKTTLPAPLYAQVIQRFQGENAKRTSSYFSSLLDGECRKELYRFNNTSGSVPFAFVLRQQHPRQVNSGEQAVALMQWIPEATRDISPGETVLVDMADVFHCPAPGNRCDTCLTELLNSTKSTCTCVRCGEGKYCSDLCALQDFNTCHMFVCKVAAEGVEGPLQKIKTLTTENSKQPVNLGLPLLLRYLSLLLAHEKRVSSDEPDKGEGERSVGLGPFLHYDHLRPVVVQNVGSRDAQEAAALKSIFAVSDDNMAEFLRNEIYASMRATVLFNSYGFPLKPNSQSQFTIEVQQVGKDMVRGGENEVIGLFHTAAHFPHSCAPNCTSEIMVGHVSASKPKIRGIAMKVTACSVIKKGQSLTLAYAPIGHLSQSERQAFLMKNFQLGPCQCSACSS